MKFEIQLMVYNSLLMEFFCGILFILSINQYIYLSIVLLQFYIFEFDL